AALRTRRCLESIRQAGLFAAALRALESECLRALRISGSQHRGQPSHRRSCGADRVRRRRVQDPVKRMFEILDWPLRRSATSILLACTCFATGASAATQSQEDVQLELQPRICTLAADDPYCDTTVRAQWKSAHDESLCLVIVGRPDIKRCWENFS